MIKTDYIVTNLRERFGIRLRISEESYPDRTEICIRPVDLNAGKGFSIISSIKWLNLKSFLKFDAYSGDVLDIIMSGHKNKVAILMDNARSIIGKNTDSILSATIKDKDLSNDIHDFDLKHFNLSIETSTLKKDIKSLEEYIIDHQTTILALILLLFDLEEDYYPEYAISEEIMEGESEGKLRRVEVNKYERSRSNRQLCLNYHGYTCKVCGFNFENFYGEIGKNFIHVHHIIPVSDIKPEYILNPIKDLIPICANCHSMVHRFKEPLSISGLINHLKRN